MNYNSSPYKPLLKELLIPSGFMKLMMAIIGAVFLVVGILIWINKGRDVALEAILPLIFMLFVFYSFLIGMMLPHQAMTMISSKSIRYLTDFRKFFSISALIYSLTIVLLAVISIFYKQPGVALSELLRNGLNIWLISSLYVMSLFFVTYRIPALQGLVFLTFSVIPHALNEVAEWNVYLLMLVLLAAWLGFSYWFLHIRPVKNHVNIFALSFQQSMMANSAANPSSNWFVNFLTPTSKPASFLGTRLMGMSDGWSSIPRMWLSFAVILLLLLLVFKWLMKDHFQGLVENFGGSFVLVLALSGYSGFMISLCRNIKPAWTFYPGSRYQMFFSVEWFLVKQKFIITLMVPILSVMINIFVGSSLVDVVDIVWLWSAASLFIFLAIYSTLYIYSRDTDNKSPISPWYAVVNFMSVMMALAISVLVAKDKHSIVASVLVVVVVICWMLRTQAAKKWRTINFVRIA